MTKVFAPHIELIRESIAAIIAYRPADRETFLANPLIQDAILMRLQVIGEHLARMRRIDEERFVQAADESWFQIIGLRNIISHGYESVDYKKIWRMISEDLPAFTASLDQLSRV
jgi:uncharacterized protein with HEPN domain